MTNFPPLVQVRRSDVMSAWSGIRPLATDPNVKGIDTASISRDHVVCLDSDGLVTVTGGKWTTYRRSVFSGGDPNNGLVFMLLRQVKMCGLCQLG
jgi:glycerol-3-phosphate dehydrogenase